MNKDQFDRMFDAAFEVSPEPSNDVSIDYRPSWHRVQQRLSARRKRKKILSRLSKLSVIAASTLIGAAIFGNTQATKAIDPIYATIKEYPSGILGFFMGRPEDLDASNAKTPPVPEHLEGLKVEKMNDNLLMATVSKAQASRLLSFEAPVFQYAPTNYSFYEAQVYFYNGNDKADQAIYQFSTEEERVMTVLLRKLPQDTTGFSMNAAVEGVNVSKIDLSDGPAILTSATNGSNSIETISHGIHITLSGIVPKDELIRMYEGMYES
jgi:hypothetical protein